MIRVSADEVENLPIIRKAKNIFVDLPARPQKYFFHGWQSWSLAAWGRPKGLPIQKPDIFHPLQVDAEYVREKRANGSWLGAVRFENGEVLLLGALATDTHVFLEENQISGRSEAGEIEWFVARGEESAVFAAYAHELGIRFGKVEKGNPPRVWCSWYSLYHMIDERIMYETFDELGDLPFDVLQVDDGWQKDIGDWQANADFPSGMEALAAKIRSTGRRAGLWLAPLIAAKSSRLFAEHADWFLRDEHGRLVSAGFNWGQPLYALDTTHPAVSEWLAALMKQVRRWGFDYLKLDFLYAGALRGKRHVDMPREAAYRECLRVLREAMGADAFFLTCGTPILPALGLCDAMRIGPDVAHVWERHRDAVLLYNPTTPGTRNAIRTSLNRLWLSPLLHVDPDVAYFESKENSLSVEQRKKTQAMALVCNFKATSDLPHWMTLEEREALRRFLEHEAVVKRVAPYVYEIDGQRVDFSRDVKLPPAALGLTALWGAFLGWLGSLPLVLRVLKKLDDDALRQRKMRI